MHPNEPKSAAAVQRWIEKHTRSSDRFAYVADKYELHRNEHGCHDVYPSSNGPLLGALAAAAKPKRLLRKGGLLISANLFLGQFAPDIPGLEKTAEYRLRILDAARWLTGYMADGTSISVRL